MKKFLSLVLALVMTMSLVTVSAGAADFTDDSKITYKEAVDVMTALGVVGGYTDGSFNPNGTLTRGAAAKIICNLMLGTTTAEALVASSAPYSDVPTDNVFAGYIAYLAKEGVVGGYADGTFKPAATLTGYAFMKMLLGVLGLDAEVEGYNEANWSIAVAKRALSESVDLTDGLVGEFNGTKAVTREEACLYAFNMLKAGKFSYETSSTIVVGNVTVKNNSKAEQAKVDEDNDGDYDNAYFTTVFSNLKHTPGDADDFGRPAHTWTMKKDEIGTYADAADEILVVTKDYATTEAAYQDKIDDKAERIGAVVEKINGRDWLNSDTSDNNWVQSGDVIEFYLNDDKDIKQTVTLRYEIGEITDVSTKLTKANKEDGATCKVEIDSKYYLDTEIAGFDADTYVEDAYVLYIVKGGEIIASQVAETVEGKVTAVKGSERKIDGTYYKNVSSEELKVGAEGTFYLNIAGQIAAFEGKDSTSNKYAYIYNLKMDTDGENADGITDVTFKAYYVTAEGTKGSAYVAYDFDEKTGKYTADDNTLLATLASGKYTQNLKTAVVAYSINSDGELVFEEPAADKIEYQGTHGTIDKKNAKIGNVYADNDTVFIFVDIDSKVTVKVVTGYKNVNIAATDLLTTVADDGDALYVFVKAENGSLSSDSKLAVLLSTDVVEEENEDEDTIYTYEVAIDGDETTLTFKSAALAKYSAGDVFAYEMDGDYAKIDAKGNKDIKDMAKVGKAASTYAVIGDVQYAIDDDTTVYTVTVEYKDSAKVNVDDAKFNPASNKTNIDTVEVAEGGKISKDDYVVYTLDGTDLDVVFVYEFIG